MSFHLYTINELYSNADGSVQLIEMSVGPFDGEGFWSGHAITVSQGGTTHSFTFPTNLPSESTANTKVLIATQGFADLGIVSPDFIVPAGFLFTNGGTVNYAGVDTASYAALPTDGATAVGRSGGTLPAFAANFAGTTAALSLIDGGAGNDTLSNRPGNDIIDGSGGIDSVTYLGNWSNFALTHNADGSYTVQDRSGAEGMDTLKSIERIQFADKKLALDMDGSAGATAKLIGAAFGLSNLTPDLVGQGLVLFEGGYTVETLAQPVIDTALFHNLSGQSAGTVSNTAFVNLVYSNVIGHPPSTDDLNYFLGLLNGGITQADLLVRAANCAENIQHVDLVGLAATGLEFA